MSKQRKVLALGIIASALFGFSAIKTAGAATAENSIIENEAQATISSEFPSAGTCCPKMGGICIVGEFHFNGFQYYSGGPCQ